LIKQIQDRGFSVSSIECRSPTATLEGSEEVINSRIQKPTCLNERFDAEQTIAAVTGQYFDWIVVDHYDLSEDWEVAVKPICSRLMVIDDLANRIHNCDLLLDQNYYKNSDRRYQDLLPTHCVCLLGPNYVLLRQEFINAKKNLHLRTGDVRRVLVFFGGSDPTNETKKILIALKQMDLDRIEVDIVVGSANPHRHVIRNMCNEIKGVNYYCDVSNMAELILRADIGIGAGGSSIWERCYLGLPSITSVVAFNQLKTTEDVASLGAIDYLGSAEMLGPENYTAAFLKLIVNPAYLKSMSTVGVNLVSGVGTSAVVDVMRKILCKAIVNPTAQM
jgi:UDP-2,4-diacetamido-2,4,6-trideoxy-beta-L-altropyranose hydrolase